jgi:hypothetical protein
MIIAPPDMTQKSQNGSDLGSDLDSDLGIDLVIDNRSCSEVKFTAR